MPKNLDPFEIKNLGIYGIIRPVEVNDRLLPQEAITEAINFHFDSKGVCTVRLGMTSIPSTAAVSSGYPCLGLYQFNYSSGSAVISVFSDGTNNDIYSLSNGFWNKTLEDDTAGSKTRFVTFANRVIRMNGTDVLKDWGSTSWITDGPPLNVGDLSGVLPKFGEVFKSKVYVLGDSTYPDRLYYSSTVSSAGNITWTPSTNYVDINPNDGENGTGLKRFGTQLCIFKPNYIYRYFGVEGTDPDPLIGIGTRSHESIVSAKDGLYFHHDTGFYKYAGEQPKELSRPISDFITTIPSSYYASITGWEDGDHVHWSIGDLTIDGVSFINIVCRYTISSEIWTIYSYDKELRFGIEYNDGNVLRQLVGTDDGFVMKFNEGTEDNGQPINYRLITKWYEIEGIENQKVIEQIASVSEKAMGSKIMYQVDDKAEWEELGQIRKYLDNFENKRIVFHRIRFKITGSSRNEAPVFKGLSIIRGINEGVII